MNKKKMFAIACLCVVAITLLCVFLVKRNQNASFGPQTTFEQDSVCYANVVKEYPKFSLDIERGDTTHVRLYQNAVSNDQDLGTVVDIAGTTGAHWSTYNMVDQELVLVDGSYDIQGKPIIIKGEFVSVTDALLGVGGKTLAIKVGYLSNDMTLAVEIDPKHVRQVFDIKASDLEKALSPYDLNWCFYSQGMGKRTVRFESNHELSSKSSSEAEARVRGMFTKKSTNWKKSAIQPVPET